LPFGNAIDSHLVGHEQSKGTTEVRRFEGVADYPHDETREEERAIENS